MTTASTEATVWFGFSQCLPVCVTGPQDTFPLEPPSQGLHCKRKHRNLLPSCLQQTCHSQDLERRLSPRHASLWSVHKINGLEAKLQDAEDISHSLRSPLAILCQRTSSPGNKAVLLCPSHKGQTRDLGCWEPPTAPPTCPSRGAMALTWKGEMWGSCRDADSPWSHG